MSAARKSQVVVIGSGAGGAVTAHELAAAGFEVLVIEEGGRFGLEQYGGSPAAALQRLYRRRGMTPLLGKVPIGFAEGCCVGGSTEINSGFWRRTPDATLARWRDEYGLEQAAPADLAPHFDWAERELSVGEWPVLAPKGTQILERGARQMGWRAERVPRAAPRCANTNACAQGCPTGAKQGMSRNLIPRAEAMGVQVVPGCAARAIIWDGTRASGVLAELQRGEARREMLRIDADHVFVCAGATQTPALLRRSGIRRGAGQTFLVHPMLKVAALFDEDVDAHRSALPLVQVSEFAPQITLGGAFFTPGHLALLLNDNWRENEAWMSSFRRIASYHVTAKGSGRGSVRPSWLDATGTVLRYELSEDDLTQLSQGMARLAQLLLGAGAREVFPGVQGLPTLRTAGEAARWLDERLPVKALSLTAVHAFSSCPIGERRARCVAGSFGRVHGFDNLYVNDASMLPDSPGVNPQATIMALARRNALHFAQTAH